MLICCIATGVFVPDPFLWFEVDGQATVVVSPLEVSRVKQSANGRFNVLSIAEAMAQFNTGSRKSSDHILAVSQFYNVKSWTVPDQFPYGLASALIEGGT